MPSLNNHKSNFLEKIESSSSNVLLFDGATGTSLQNLNLKVSDFGKPELEGCNEILVKTAPEKVELVHKKVPYGKNKLNGQFKDSLALLIKSEVTKGNNTFAKIKKVLGSRYSDNELRCGVRQARKFNKRCYKYSSGTC